MPKQTSPKNFEESLQELELIIARMESGQVSLEDSLALYQRGAFLLQHCQKTLLDAEQQVRMLTEAQELKPLVTRDD